MNTLILRHFCALILLLVCFTGCTDDEIINAPETDTEETIDDSGNGDTNDIGDSMDNGDAPDNEDAPDNSDTPENPVGETTPEETMCTEPLHFVFNEKDGLLLAEFEDAEFTADWSLKTDGNNYSGAGYMVWEGDQSLGNPGNGTATFKLNIENPGTYQFIWNSSVTLGDNGTEHNDTWLRFNDAADFFGFKAQTNSTVYPKDTGKTPNPEGASKDGWFKVYRGGNDLDFKWQSATNDGDAHDIFVVFNAPGTYLMEISARSSGHGIDKFALFNSNVSKTDATNSTDFSAISCDE